MRATIFLSLGPVMKGFRMLTSRRNFVLKAGCLPLAGWVFMQPWAAGSVVAQELAGEKVSSTKEQVAAHFVVQMEASGTLELDPNGKKVTTTPFRVRADFDFVQSHQHLGSQLWTAQDFKKAEAQIQVGRGSTVSRLTDLSEILVHRVDQVGDALVEHEFLRPSLGLEAEEIDLVFLPAISPVINAWVTPAFERSVGETWEPKAWSVAAALAIDAVTQSSLQCKLRRKASGVIEVGVQGVVQGVANSVPTEITLTGRCIANSSTQEVESLVWEIQEKRALGPATPGFDARTKVEVTRSAPVTWNAEQQAQFEAVIAQGDEAGGRLVFESKRHGFRLQHGPHWKVIGDQSQAAILRFVDSGDLIAQAHLTRLVDLPQGTRLSPQKYREDVAKAIEGTQGQIVDVHESETSRGYQVLRVVVSSSVSGVPIQWIYYHVADTQGRRVGWVITMEQDRLDRFGAEDQVLIEEFELLDQPPKAPAVKTAEKKPAESSATVDK
jgi:hypothetical protein